MATAKSPRAKATAGATSVERRLRRARAARVRRGGCSVARGKVVRRSAAAAAVRRIVTSGVERDRVSTWRPRRRVSIRARPGPTLCETMTDEVHAAPVHDPDAELVRRAGAGDRAACTLLVDRHLTRVHALAYRLLGNRADAEEVAQDVFLRVWAHAARWQPGEIRFAAWIHRVTQNLCTDRARRRREHADDALATLADSALSTAAQLERAATEAAVRAAVAALPERQREAIALCHFEQHSNIEAAAMLGVSVEALESLLARGRRALRERLADWLHAGPEA